MLASRKKNKNPGGLIRDFLILSVAFFQYHIVGTAFHDTG